MENRFHPFSPIVIFYTILRLKDYQIWDVFFALAKLNEGRRSSATLTEVTHSQNEKDAQRCKILEEE